MFETVSRPTDSDLFMREALRRSSDLFSQTGRPCPNTRRTPSRKPAQIIAHCLFRRPVSDKLGLMQGTRKRYREAVEALTKAVFALELASHDMLADPNTLGAQIFMARRRYYILANVKGGDPHQAARLSWREAKAIGFRGNLKQWETLMMSPLMRDAIRPANEESAPAAIARLAAGRTPGRSPSPPAV